MAEDLPHWLDHITRLHPQTMDFGLERIRQVAESAQLLPPAKKNLVVAGTNGKGSTCVVAESLLMAQGYSVGTTLSPHINRYQERFRINGQIAGDKVLVAAFERVEAARTEVTLTYFEFSILVAFALFQNAGVDVAVLEVGLGGRLDAVNLVDADVAVITSIGKDHEDYLGDDIELIGTEKAGIIRPGKPLILGARKIPDSVFQRAGECRTQTRQLGVAFDHRMEIGVEKPSWDYLYTAAIDGTDTPCLDLALTRLKLPQIALDNVATAITAVAALTDLPTAKVIDSATKQARLSARFQVAEVQGRVLVVDLAHNPPAAEFLAAQLSAHFSSHKVVAVAGFLKGKDIPGMVAALAAQVDQWVIVPTHGERGQDAAKSLELMAQAQDRDRNCLAENRVCAESVTMAIEKAVSVTGPSDVILVFGSFGVIQQVFAGGFLT